MNSKEPAQPEKEKASSSSKRPREEDEPSSSSGYLSQITVATSDHDYVTLPSGRRIQKKNLKIPLEVFLPWNPEESRTSKQSEQLSKKSNDSSDSSDSEDSDGEGKSKDSKESSSENSKIKVRYESDISSASRESEDWSDSDVSSSSSDDSDGRLRQFRSNLLIWESESSSDEDDLEIIEIRRTDSEGSDKVEYEVLQKKVNKEKQSNITTNNTSHESVCLDTITENVSRANKGASGHLESNIEGMERDLISQLIVAETRDKEVEEEKVDNATNNIPVESRVTSVKKGGVPQAISSPVTKQYEPEHEVMVGCGLDSDPQRLEYTKEDTVDEFGFTVQKPHSECENDNGIRVEHLEMERNDDIVGKSYSIEESVPQEPKALNLANSAENNSRSDTNIGREHDCESELLGNYKQEESVREAVISAGGVDQETVSSEITETELPKGISSTTLVDKDKGNGEVILPGVLSNSLIKIGTDVCQTKQEIIEEGSVAFKPSKHYTVEITTFTNEAYDPSSLEDDDIKLGVNINEVETFGPAQSNCGVTAEEATTNNKMAFSTFEWSETEGNLNEVKDKGTQEVIFAATDSFKPEKDSSVALEEENNELVKHDDKFESDKTKTLILAQNPKEIDYETSSYSELGGNFTDQDSNKLEVSVVPKIIVTLPAENDKKLKTRQNSSETNLCKSTPKNPSKVELEDKETPCSELEIDIANIDPDKRKVFGEVDEHQTGQSSSEINQCNSKDFNQLGDEEFVKLKEKLNSLPATKIHCTRRSSRGRRSRRFPAFRRFTLETIPELDESVDTDSDELVPKDSVKTDEKEENTSQFTENVPEQLLDDFNTEDEISLENENVLEELPAVKVINLHVPDFYEPEIIPDDDEITDTLDRNDEVEDTKLSNLNDEKEARALTPQVGSDAITKENNLIEIYITEHNVTNNKVPELNNQKDEPETKLDDSVAEMEDNTVILKDTSYPDGPELETDRKENHEIETRVSSQERYKGDATAFKIQQTPEPNTGDDIEVCDPSQNDCHINNDSEAAILCRTSTLDSKLMTGESGIDFMNIKRDYEKYFDEELVEWEMPSSSEDEIDEENELLDFASDITDQVKQNQTSSFRVINFLTDPSKEMETTETYTENEVQEPSGTNIETPTLKRDATEINNSENCGSLMSKGEIETQGQYAENIEPSQTDRETTIPEIDTAQLLENRNDSKCSSLEIETSGSPKEKIETTKSLNKIINIDDHSGINTDTAEQENHVTTETYRPEKIMYSARYKSPVCKAEKPEPKEITTDEQESETSGDITCDLQKIDSDVAKSESDPTEMCTQVNTELVIPGSDHEKVSDVEKQESNRFIFLNSESKRGAKRSINEAVDDDVCILPVKKTKTHQAVVKTTNLHNYKSETVPKEEQPLTKSEDTVSSSLTEISDILSSDDSDSGDGDENEQQPEIIDGRKGLRNEVNVCEGPALSTHTDEIVTISLTSQQEDINLHETRTKVDLNETTIAKELGEETYINVIHTKEGLKRGLSKSATNPESENTEGTGATDDKLNQQEEYQQQRSVKSNVVTTVIENGEIDSIGLSLPHEDANENENSLNFWRNDEHSIDKTQHLTMDLSKSIINEEKSINNILTKEGLNGGFSKPANSENENTMGVDVAGAKQNQQNEYKQQENVETVTKESASTDSTKEANSETYGKNDCEGSEKVSTENVFIVKGRSARMKSFQTTPKTSENTTDNAAGSSRNVNTVKGASNPSTGWKKVDLSDLYLPNSLGEPDIDLRSNYNKSWNTFLAREMFNSSYSEEEEMKDPTFLRNNVDTISIFTEKTSIKDSSKSTTDTTRSFTTEEPNHQNICDEEDHSVSVKKVESSSKESNLTYDFDRQGHVNIEKTYTPNESGVGCEQTKSVTNKDVKTFACRSNFPIISTQSNQEDSYGQEDEASVETFTPTANLSELNNTSINTIESTSTPKSNQQHNYEETVLMNVKNVEGTVTKGNAQDDHDIREQLNVKDLELLNDESGSDAQPLQSVHNKDNKNRVRFSNINTYHKISNTPSNEDTFNYPTSSSVDSYIKDNRSWNYEDLSSDSSDTDDDAAGDSSSSKPKKSLFTWRNFVLVVVLGLFTYWVVFVDKEPLDESDLL